MKSNIQKYFNITEASQLLGISPKTLRRWEDDGKISCIRTDGGQRRFSRNDLERILGKPIEEVTEIIKETDPLKVKKREVASFELEVKKQKAIQTLSELEGEGEQVQDAREELELLKIESEKEKLLRGRREAEVIRQAQERYNKWLQVCMRFAFMCFTGEHIVSHPDPEPIPYKWKLRIKEAIEMALSDMTPDDDIDTLRQVIIETVAEIRSMYNEASLPRYKSEVVDSGMAYAYSLFCPYWIDARTKDNIIMKVKTRLEPLVTGYESYEELYPIVTRLWNEEINSITAIRKTTGVDKPTNVFDGILNVMDCLKKYTDG